MTENLLPESLVCSFRWVKFEEDVEDGSNRWSKPHVATLSLHSLFELRNLLTKGTILLDMEASKYEINFIHLLDSFLIVALISLSNVLGFLLFFHEFLSSPNSNYRWSKIRWWDFHWAETEKLWVYQLPIFFLLSIL